MRNAGIPEEYIQAAILDKNMQAAIMGRQTGKKWDW
jgi:hypothetical protein